MAPDFDPTLLRKLGFPDDRETREIVDNFLDRLDEEIASGASELAAGAVADFRRRAHRLQGAAASLGFARLADFLAARGRAAEPHEWGTEAAALVAAARRARAAF